MRVLIVQSPVSAGSGAEVMARRSATALRARGHEVSVAAPDALVPADVVHAVDLVDSDAALHAARVARRWGVPFALTPASAPAVWRDPAASAAACRAADVVFVLSDAERTAMLALGVDADRLSDLPQAPDLDEHGDGDRFRRRFGLDGPIVLFVGRRTPSKGCRHLVAAAPAVRAAHPRAHIVLIGPPWDDDAPGAPPPDAGVVDLGLVDAATKADALAAADVVCLPSVAEVFPLVFVEAWWHGVPVISGPFPGAHEVVGHGVDGLVVAADPVAVADAVDALLADPRRARHMGRAGRRRAERTLSWTRVAECLEAAYRHAGASRTPAVAQNW